MEWHPTLQPWRYPAAVRNAPARSQSLPIHKPTWPAQLRPNAGCDCAPACRDRAAPRLLGNILQQPTCRSVLSHHLVMPVSMWSHGSGASRRSSASKVSGARRTVDKGGKRAIRKGGTESRWDGSLHMATS